EGTGWYHVHRGRITSGLTGVEWALTDVPAGSGGFCCLPGSHKANFELEFSELADCAEDIPVSAGGGMVFSPAPTPRPPRPGARSAARAHLQVLPWNGFVALGCVGRDSPGPAQPTPAAADHPPVQLRRQPQGGSSPRLTNEPFLPPAHPDHEDPRDTP